MTTEETRISAKRPNGRRYSNEVVRKCIWMQKEHLWEESLGVGQGTKKSSP
jgi:hypothetical protein